MHNYQIFFHILTLAGLFDKFWPQGKLNNLKTAMLETKLYNKNVRVISTHQQLDEAH